MRHLLAGGAALAFAISCTAPVYAQETTSAIAGSVTSNGAPVVGATVTVTHIPTGTRSTATTDSVGAYSLPGLRAGGPYTVSVIASGYTDYQVTDVNTAIGQTFQVPLDLQPVSQAAATGNSVIIVTAARVKGARSVSHGPAMIMNANQISKVASVNRDIRDLMERDPFATLDTTQSTGRQVSFAGVNPRFNRFTVDGVPITDSFGLNPDALPSRRGPVPLDAIGQFETKVAPYDIREGFFQGGVINAVLKSGTNQFHGTGFYTQSSDKLQGDRTRPYIGTDAQGRVKVLPYKSRDFGATLSGPIIKDKLFFMISGERVRASTPLPYGTVDDNGGNPVTGLTSATFNAVTATAQSRYNVNAGGIQRNNGDKDDRLVGRLDANISSTQRLSLTGIYTKDSIITPGTTSSSSLSTQSNDYVKPNRVIAGVAQLNSDWSDKVSTETRFMYKDYKSGQNPLLANTALATVCTDNATGTGLTNTVNSTATGCSTGTSSVLVGPQTSAQANVLHVKTFGGSLVTRFTFGDHRVRLLLDGQNSNNYNLFVNGARGSYYFDTLQAFQAGVAQSFSYTNATSGDQNDAAARFSYQTYTIGLQDDWKVNSKLSVSAGLRYDLFGGDTKPAANRNFVARQGFPNNYYINGKDLLQPRIGFDYAATSRLGFHGGGGIFGGGTPDVYVGNSFSASGVQPASFTTTNNPAFLNNVNLATLPGTANSALQAAAANSSVSALAKNFKIPSLWRATLSTTYKANLGPLGDDWNFGADVLFSKTRNALQVRDLRNRPITGANALTPDGRQRYYDVVCNNPTSTVCTTDSQGDYVMGNTSKGRGWVLVAHMDKAWDSGFSIGGSFTYQDIRDQNALTSSVASSNYGNTAYLDPNNGAYGHSNDEVRYSFKYNLSYEHAFFRDYKTRFDLFGQTRIGSPYSYTFQDQSSTGNTRSNVFGTVGSNSRYLFYVPTGPNDPKAVYSNALSQQLIENLINSTDLKKYRGKVAPRNAFNSKWFTKIDLHLEQEIPTFIGGSRISVFADIENFLNMLNHKWGQTLRSSFPYSKTVGTVACAAANGNSCDHYVYTTTQSTINNTQDQLVNYYPGTSLYAIRVGARFTF
jgi:hypothetical protein